MTATSAVPSAPSVGGRTHAPVPVLLAELQGICALYWPGIRLTLVGEVAGQEVLRLVCPPELPAVDEDSIAGQLLAALREAGDPMTLREASYAAIGGPPHGGVKRSMKKLVESGRVRQLPTDPITYDLA